MIQINTTKEEAVKQWEQWKKDNPTIYDSNRKKCICCGATDNLQLHHVDGDKRNNNLDNLECLCRECHWDIHLIEKVQYVKPDIEVVTKTFLPFYKRRWWQKKKN